MAAEKVYEKLKELSIPFEIIEHEAALTVEEMEKVLPEMDAQVCKNLFLRNQKGNQHYLVVMAKEKPFNLKEFEQKQGLGKLSFASEKRLLKYLGVPSGSVSPFGLINDSTNHVIVYIDQDLKQCDKVGVHPNINSATITFKASDLEKYIKSLDNEVYWVKM
ncbi:prolyl-tRNA synthetase associated domain-containing protein [Irregularibacter muris]|uniref:Prolyl-tRNA synthetase associated domain-containing protein n=2 Tax=Irregularibacter muris TaxID=1796619 RepID=A0AAE3HI48_9FIRM|nr:prolyl-tRNA synthetase associated domain-containing protein [Irregularibacter muris]